MFSGQIAKTPESQQKKPYTAVTVHVEQLTGEQYEENDFSGIPDLVEVIRIQDSGPAEAARAIRKKLKYGNMHRQLRALTILDGLMQNAGARFQRTFADEPLLERLRLLPRDDLVDADVRTKCNMLYRQWAVAYKNTPGMGNIATLYQQLPRTRKPQPSQSRVVRETEEEAQREEAESPPPSPVQHRRTPSTAATASSSSWTPQRPVTLEKTDKSSSFFHKSHKDKDKKSKRKPFNLEKERPKITETIANANIAATNLYNALRLINREHQRVSENKECVNRFDTCKVLRRQVLRYIQLVESENFLGSLLSANDELVKALMAYEFMDKSIDDDSDSDPEYESAKMARRTSGQADQQDAFATLNLNDVKSPPKAARPTSLAIPPVPTTVSKQRKLQPEPESEDDDLEEDEDDDDPFADRNAVKTPHVEKSGLTWRDV